MDSSYSDEEDTDNQQDTEQFELIRQESRTYQQNRAFVGWVNCHLQQASMRINNLEDISKVSPLIHLLEILEKKPLHKITKNHKKPRNNFDKMEGMRTCLTHIKRRERSISNPFDAETLLSGKELKIYLALIWRIIINYGIDTMYENDDSVEVMNNNKNENKQNNDIQQKQPKQQSKKIIKSAEQRLKDWVNTRLSANELQITNFTNEWSDGNILILISNQALDKQNQIQHENIKHMNNKQCLDYILEINDKYLNIPQLLDSKDLITSPSKQAVMTYVLLLKAAIENKQAQQKQKELEEENKEAHQLVYKKTQSIMITGSDNKTLWFEDYYQLEELLGEPGTFGMAYRCYKKTDENKTSFAVKKIIKTKYYFNKKTHNVLENMKNEIQILKALRENEYICSLHQVYEDRNYLYLLLDYLQGGELLGKIEDEDGLTEIYAASIVKQILTAVKFMHDKNIVHLDLKPENILFVTCQQIKIKIIDFGEGKIMKSPNEKLNVKIGTPYFMAPAMLTDKPLYNPFKSDVWSIGVITFCMLFGFIPFWNDDNDEKVIFANIRKGFKSDVCIGYGAWFPMDIPVSKAAMDIISGMLRYDERDRYSIDECLQHEWLNTKFSDKLTLPIPNPIHINPSKSGPKPAMISNNYEVFINQDDYCEIKTQMEEILDENIIKQGYLYKEGKLFKTWKKRWFVLNKNGCIAYYGTHLEQDAKGTFDIKNYSQIIKSKKMKNGIIVCTVDRNYKLICASNKSRNQWIDAFKMLKNNSKNNKHNELEIQKFKELLKNGVKCGSGDLWWTTKNSHSNSTYVLKLQRHKKENDMVKFSRKVAFWSNHADKYRIILGEKKSNKCTWMEIYHSSKDNDIQQKYDNYKSILML